MWLDAYKCGALLGIAWSVQVAALAAEPAYRFSAPIEVRQPAPFVQLALPASAYGRSLQPDLRDLRIVDSRGERVPFAVLGARAEVQTTEQLHDAVLYPLPPRPGPNGVWQAPVEIVVEGEHIRVRKGGAAAGARLAIAPGAAANAGRSGGWLIDLGERKPEEPVPRWLRMQWSGPAEFSAAFGYETSDDLRSWRPGGSGQLLALASATGPLTQPSIALSDAPGRFIRLVWADASAAPVITGAKVVANQRSSVALDAPTDLVVTPSPEPSGKSALADDAKRALHFDLGGVLPLVEADLQLEAGTRVAPVRVQGRNRADEAWRDLAQGVFYRLERGGSVGTSPPLALHATARYLRVVPDERAAPLNPGTTRLALKAQLASLVFAAQGQAPFKLLAGSNDAPPSALPATTLVPNLDGERARFGHAALGTWSEVAAVAKRMESERREAQWRPWLLWAVLLAGVAGLAFMVWRLARPADPTSPTKRAAPNVD